MFSLGGRIMSNFFLFCTFPYMYMYHYFSKFHSVQISSVQMLSCVRLFVSPCTVAHQTSLSITNSWSLLKLMSIESLMPSNHLILCHLLLLMPSILPSIRVFCNESVLCIRWPKYWSFSFSISSSNEFSEFISFTMDWLDFLAIQGTLNSLLNTIVQKHQFFGTLSSLWSNSHSTHDYWKNHSLTIWTFVGKVISAF